MELASVISSPPERGGYGILVLCVERSKKKRFKNSRKTNLSYEILVLDLERSNLADLMRRSDGDRPLQPVQRVSDRPLGGGGRRRRSDRSHKEPALALSDKEIICTASRIVDRSTSMVSSRSAAATDASATPRPPFFLLASLSAPPPLLPMPMPRVLGDSRRGAPSP